MGILGGLPSSDSIVVVRTSMPTWGGIQGSKTSLVLMASVLESALLAILVLEERDCCMFCRIGDGL